MAEFFPFESKLARVWPPARWNEVTTLVGLSGGADSVALLRALCRIQSAGSGRLVAAHFNHHWRGAESEEDARFCRELSGALGIQCVVGGFAPRNVLAKSEEAARRERYAFFKNTAGEVGARYLVLAHHRDDQVETVLQRLIRGTSLRGLSGMQPLRRLSELTTIVRPLLTCPRSAIERYLASLGQPFRTDSTNLNPAWLRNRIRIELIPLLKTRYAKHASRSIARLAKESSEAMSFLEGMAREVVSKTAQFNLAAAEVTLKNFEGLHPYVLRLALTQLWRLMNWPEGQMTRRRWRKLTGDLLSKKNGSLGQYPGAIHVHRINESCCFRRES